MRASLTLTAAALASLMPIAGFCGGTDTHAESVRKVKSAVRTRLLSLEPDALAEAFPLAIEALEIHKRAGERQAKHRAKLAELGLAEVPACEGMRYTPDTGGLFREFSFNERGQFYIDRRFVTDSEMKTIRRIEAWIRKWFPAETRRRGKGERGKAVKQADCALPVFSGFEDERYQQHDALISKLVKEFNADKAAACGGTSAQAAKIPDLSAAVVKSHMIEESGGNGARSRAAWLVDPLQVNVPGDWGDEKMLVGLSKPERRNEGSAETNVRAAIRYLSRKGFSTSARPAKAVPKESFSGWTTALRRYNGRRDRTDTDRHYSDEYADKILKRAENPDVFVPIEIKLAAKKQPRTEKAE